MLSDPGKAKYHEVFSVAFAITYKLGLSTSLISLGALSLKGDYLHPMADYIAVYTSR